MIVDFTVKNFRSIKEEQTLSMLASTSIKDKNSERTISSPNEPNIRLLKTSLVYGANASGKTNLLLSLSAFTYFIIISTDMKVGDRIPIYEPYRLDRKSQILNSFQKKKKKQILEDLKAQPLTFHKLYEGEEEIGSIRFDLDDESDGTIKMYDLAGKIIETLRQGSTLVIDELDSSMHTLMVAHIISLFKDPKINLNGAQLIAATHDVSLLNPELLKRDQIWFTEKNKFGATELYSLDEFDKNQVRNDTNFGRWYLDGRFGALPMITPRIFSIKEENEKPKDAEIQEPQT